MTRRYRVGLRTLLILGLLLASYGAAQPAGVLQQIPTPNPGTSSNALVDIAAAADGTAWAVGSRSGPTTEPLILRFDGTNWAEFTVPPEVAGIAFGAAGSTPEGDVWLSGTRAFSVYEREVFFLRARGGVIDRVDMILSAGAPVALTANSANDVWALTGAGDVVHFDGSEWTESPVPQVFDTLNYPESIHAAGIDDVWIVGYGGDQRGDYEGYVQHWNGSAWSVVPTPFTGQMQTYFRDIDGSAPTEVWIVGDSAAQHLSLQWNGSAWIQRTGPPSSTPLCDVVVLGPNEVWAAPYSLAPGSKFARWDGVEWGDGPTIDIPNASTVAWRGLTRADAGNLWAAGSFYSSSHFTLAAKLSTGLTTAAPEDHPERPAVTLQAYPNPFNPATTIRYQLDRPGSVSLRIYDALGRLHDTLFVDRWHPTGIYAEPYSPPGASGAYFATVTFEDQRTTTKLMLVK